MGGYTHLNLKEREELFLELKNGTDVPQIAKKLKRHKSSIYREIGRNTENKNIGYLPERADRLASERKTTPVLKLNKQPTLKELVINQLRNDWSPEVIAGKMKLDQGTSRISHETIYKFVYSPEGRSLALFRCLLRGKPKRGKMFSRKSRKNIIPERVSVHDRPGHINTRSEFGHYEGDLTFNQGNQSMNIATIIERKSRFTFLIKNSSKRMPEVMSKIFNKIAPLPAPARKSMTFDNGTEFVGHTLLKKGMGMDTFFCDPHSPWQKGSVEKTNSMIHRYIPKKRSLASVSVEELALVQEKLNNTPRKILGYGRLCPPFYTHVDL